MYIITKYPEKYKDKEIFKDCDVFAPITLNYHTQYIIKRYPEAKMDDSMELYNTINNKPCLILGCGTSAELIRNKIVKCDVLAVNRAIHQYPNAKFWLCHDDLGVAEIEHEKNVTLVTQSCMGHDWKNWRSGVSKVYLIDVNAYPERFPRDQNTIIYYQSTVSWGIPLAIKMGYNPIYLLGIDSSKGNYIHPRMDKEELIRQHLGVQERLLTMFSEKERWLDREVDIIDLAPNGYLPVKKGDISSVL